MCLKRFVFVFLSVPEDSSFRRIKMIFLPKNLINSPCLFIFGVFGVLAVCFILMAMFSTPVISFHDQIKQNTVRLMREENHEWVPIEALSYGGKLHLESGIVLTLYRVVAHVVLTSCDSDSFSELLSSMYRSPWHRFVVDVHFAVHCPSPKTKSEQNALEEIMDLISSFRWYSGRVTASVGAPLRSRVEYIASHWLPVTNWEISMFLDEKHLMSSNWYGELERLLDESLVYVKNQQLKKIVRENKLWQSPFTYEDFTLPEVLGFSLTSTSKEDAKGSSFLQRETNIAFSDGLLLFPAKWMKVKKSLLNSGELENISAMSEDELIQQISGAMGRHRLKFLTKAGILVQSK